MKIVPYYRTINIVQVTLVSGNIRFMRIFVGFPGEGASNDSGVIGNVSF